MKTPKFPYVHSSKIQNAAIIKAITQIIRNKTFSVNIDNRASYMTPTPPSHLIYPHTHLLASHNLQARTLASDLVERDSALATLGSVKGVSDGRTLTLKQEAIVNGSTSDGAKNRDDEGNKEVKALCRENLAAVDDGGEETGAKVTCGVDGLFGS